MPAHWTDAGPRPINPPESTGPELDGAPERLAELAERIKSDLFNLRHPETPWVVARPGPDARPMLDVLIAGAGQGGLAIAGLLKREQVSNILLVDKASDGKEGAWNDFARTPLIRSPKHYPGPDMGIPSLTYETWHRTRFGDPSWDALVRVPIAHWVAYLAWVREVLELPVRNETALERIEPIEGGLALTLRSTSGDEETVFARRLVLATGHDGTGSWWMPQYITELAPHLRAQAADPIDFDALAGKRVAVLGVGASAADNALCALEAGAESVHMFCRRDTHRRQQIYRWCITAGFMRHFRDLDDAWRWRFMQYILNVRMGMPPETWQRLGAFSNFELHTNATWKDVSTRGDAVEIDLGDRAFATDFIIAATGHDQRLEARPELAPFAHLVARWADRYTPPPELTDERLSRYPYIGWNFELTEREPGAAPWLERIHDFTFGPTLSYGPSGCSISTLRLPAPMLVAGVTRGLFTEDVDRHWESMLAHPNMIP